MGKAAHVGVGRLLRVGGLDSVRGVTIEKKRLLVMLLFTVPIVGLFFPRWIL